jgi:AraC-like DNA-binding protein
VNASTFLVFEQRASDSPFVEQVWRSHSTRAGSFLSLAASHCGLVVTRLEGTVRVTLRGPETKATIADCPAGGEWLGIQFALGTFFPRYPAAMLRDRRDADLPGATSRTFWLHGSAWESPSFENAEVLVARLAKAGVIARDPAVGAALCGDMAALSRRSVQRHFLHATGMTHRAVRQIERARLATRLLTQGISIQEVVHRAGYFDQAHLTRALKRLVGETPAQVRRQEQQLSLLYKTRAAP